MFKVGDIVEAWGVRGKVIKIGFPGIHVELDNGLEKVFTEDGRHMDWHKEPSLKLVSRPRQKVKKTLYPAVIKHQSSSYHGVNGPAYVYSAASYFEHEAHARDFFKDRTDFVGLGPAIEIEVDSE